MLRVGAEEMRAASEVSVKGKVQVKG